MLLDLKEMAEVYLRPGKKNLIQEGGVQVQTFTEALESKGVRSRLSGEFQVNQCTSSIRTEQQLDLRECL